VFVLRAELAYQDQAPLGIEWDAQPAAAPEPTAAVRTAATLPVTPPTAGERELPSLVLVTVCHRDLILSCMALSLFLFYYYILF